MPSSILDAVAFGHRLDASPSGRLAVVTADGSLRMGLEGEWLEGPSHVVSDAAWVDDERLVVLRDLGEQSALTMFDAAGQILGEVDLGYRACSVTRAWSGAVAVQQGEPSQIACTSSRLDLVDPASGETVDTFSFDAPIWSVASDGSDDWLLMAQGEGDVRWIHADGRHGVAQDVHAILVDWWIHQQQARSRVTVSQSSPSSRVSRMSCTSSPIWHAGPWTRVLRKRRTPRSGRLGPPAGRSPIVVGGRIELPTPRFSERPVHESWRIQRT